MGLGSSKPDSTPSTPPTAPSTRSGGAKLDKLPEALQGMVLGNLGLDCHLAVKKSSVALATTAVPFASSNSYGLSSRVMRARVRPLMRLRAYLESKSVALKSKSPVKKKTVMKPGAQPGNKNARRVLVHRFDPKTGKKMGKSTSKRGIAVMWMKYPKGYTGGAGFKALAPAKAKNGVWAVHALLGEGQTPGRGKQPTGELMYFREG